MGLTIRMLEAKRVLTQILRDSVSWGKPSGVGSPSEPDTGGLHPKIFPECDPGTLLLKFLFRGIQETSTPSPKIPTAS